MARDWPFVNFIFFNINYVGYTKRKMEGKSIIIAYKYKIFDTKKISTAKEKNG